MAEQPSVSVRLESSAFNDSDVRVYKLSGREAIGQLFQFDIELSVFGADGLNAEEVAGARVSIVFERDGVEERRVNGIVAQIEDHLETEREVRTYALRIVPSLYQSTLVETQEIYLDLNVPDIIRQKLELVGIGASALEMRLLEGYPTREFTTQYRETDLSFVSRLCEHLGISIFFEHDASTDKVIFTDHPAGFPLLEGDPIPFRPRGENLDVYELRATTQIIPENYIVYDYNYRTPRVDLTAIFDLPTGFAGGVAEYGVHTKTPEESAYLARVRAEERQARQKVFHGKSDVCTFRAGARFQLDGHAHLEGADLLLVEVEHEASQPVLLHGGSTEKPQYRNTFRAIPADRMYRPERRVPRPRIWGVVTGIVEPNAEGKVEDYAKLDEHGRYKIQFHFDTAPVGRPKPSRWVRMAQPHSGPNYGMHFPLKPGVEVACIFVDGDPDRPVIVATVPNPITRSPVTQTESRLNRLVTRSGVIMEIDDGVA